jgi:hypothetical protein
MAQSSPPVADIVDWARKGPKKHGVVGVGKKAWEKARGEAREMMGGADWSAATARHFAALYEILHEIVYGVSPAEMTPKLRSLSSIWAAQMLKRDFGGEPVEMASFMRWAWNREKEREEWRRVNGREGGRIGPRLMFSGSMVTDHHLHLARRAK